MSASDGEPRRLKRSVTSRLVYSDGLDLGIAGAASPIGTGCRICERLDCPQRAVPPLGRPLAIDENTCTFVPYQVADRPPGEDP